jgi:hypothetical protein
MESFFLHPFFYISAAFALVAAMGFLIFLRGFIGGIGDVFTMTGHVTHVQEAQTRAVWGVFILTSVFVVWEVVRWVASWFI